VSAAAARASTSALAGARGTVPGQPTTALPAAMPPDADARQSGLPTMAARLGTGALAGEMRTNPRASSPPAALAAPPAIAVSDALGIEMAGGDIEGVAQRILTSDYTNGGGGSCDQSWCGGLHEWLRRWHLQHDARSDVCSGCNPRGNVTGRRQPLHPRGNGTGRCQPLPERHHCYGG